VAERRVTREIRVAGLSPKRSRGEGGIRLRGDEETEREFVRTLMREGETQEGVRGDG
jgi:hypothetical protein